MTAALNRRLRARTRTAPHLAAAAAYAALLTASPAHANADGDLLTKLGVVGTWAEDCSKPAGAANARLVYRAPADGPPTEQLIYTADGSRPGTVLRDVKVTAPGKVQWKQTDGDITFVIVNLLEKTRLRTWSSIDITGKVYIRDGGYALTTGSAPWFNKCGAS